MVENNCKYKNECPSLENYTLGSRVYDAFVQDRCLHYEKCLAYKNLKMQEIEKQIEEAEKHNHTKENVEKAHSTLRDILDKSA